MNIPFTDISGFSIVIAGIITLIRWNGVQKHYYPFLYFIVLACLNEILAVILAYKGYHTTINNNIYVLCESLLITWFFERNGLFKKKNTVHVYTALLVLVWLIETLLVNDINQISSYFRILYSFGTILMSITIINTLLVSGEQELLKNPLFLIAMAFIFYYMYKALFESFWIYGLTSSKAFRMLLYRIHNYINLFTNLIYALAVLWMPRKQPSILPS